MKLTLLSYTAQDTVNAFTQTHHTSAQAFTCSLEKCVWLLSLSPALLKQLKAQLYNLLYSEWPGGNFKWVLPAVLTTVSRRKSRAPPVQGIILQHFTDFRQNSVYTNTPTEACVRDAETRQKEIKPAPQYSDYIYFLRLKLFILNHKLITVIKYPYKNGFTTKKNRKKKIFFLICSKTIFVGIFYDCYELMI